MTQEEAEKAVIEILGEEKAKIWWATKNPCFGGLIPIRLVQFGRGHKVYEFIEDAIDCLELTNETL